MTDGDQLDVPARAERGADRNRRTLGPDDQASAPVLPSLDGGVTLLEVDGRGVPVLQSLALDHLFTHDGPAFWVDTAGCARTTTLARVAPTWRLLERVHVARGFTPYQHHAAVADVPDAVAQTTRSTGAERPHGGDAVDESGSDAPGPALLVAPVVDGRYRDADDLPHEHARQLLARTLARLRRYADAYDAPVLLTRTGDGADAFAEIVANCTDHRLRCERTPQGPRFVGDDDVETLVYPQPDGTLQTTLAYWRTVLKRRATASGVGTPNGPVRTPAPTDPPGRFDDSTGAFAAGDEAAGVAPGGRAAHERALSPWQHHG